MVRNVKLLKALKINVLFLSGKQGILGVGEGGAGHTHQTHTHTHPPEAEGYKRHEDEPFGNTDLSPFCLLHHMLTTALSYCSRLG